MGLDYDYATTALSTRNMLLELAGDPEAGARGFVSDVVAVFPIAEAGAQPRSDGFAVREVSK